MHDQNSTLHFSSVSLAAESNKDVPAGRECVLWKKQNKRHTIRGRKKPVQQRMRALRPKPDVKMLKFCILAYYRQILFMFSVRKSEMVMMLQLLCTFHTFPNKYNSSYCFSQFYYVNVLILQQLKSAWFIKYESCQRWLLLTLNHVLFILLQLPLLIVSFFAWSTDNQNKNDSKTCPLL